MDSYARKAHKEGYASRSAYKLQAIIKKFHPIPQGGRVLDLGAAPGGWMQVAAETVGLNGIVVGVDLGQVSVTGDNIRPIVGNIFDPSCLEKIRSWAPYDSIISDMAPKTTGIKIRDQEQSQALVDCVISLSDELLKRRGSLIAKIFQGASMDYYTNELKKRFKSVRNYKPKASRERSFETYLIALHKH